MNEIVTVQNFDWKQLISYPKQLNDLKLKNDKAILNFAVLTDATDTATSTTSNVVKTIVLSDIVIFQ